jgi:glycosyltransferase involved in cell wall biosynthesis
MSVTIIIPTLCASDREHLLRRAIDSVSDQLPQEGRLVVVANGDRCDERIFRELQGNPRVVVARLVEGNVAKAQRYGRSLVSTEYFAFLDDDDEYLPGAIEKRCGYLGEHPEVDVVVTNGLRCLEGVEVPAVEEPNLIEGDLLRSLSRGNWLASCAGLFRSRSVGSEFFDGSARYLEWTLLAYRLAIQRIVRFVDVSTYRINETDGSASQSRQYLEAIPSILERVKALDLPEDVRAAIRVRISAAEHDLAGYNLANGDRAAAWIHHLRSLKGKGLFQYAAYTRRILTSQT